MILHFLLFCHIHGLAYMDLHTHAQCTGVLDADVHFFFLPQAEKCVRISWTQSAKEGPLHQEHEAV